MKLGILGIGNVGGALGQAWARQGHQIMFGVRTLQSDKIQALLKTIGPGASVGSVAEAAAFGQVAVLAVPWSAVEGVLQAAGNLEGKILIDCTNPFLPGGAGLAVGHSTSAAEQIANWAPGAHVVKAFNSTGSGNMANPDYGPQAATMFFCGDETSSKAAVAKLGQELGFDMVDAGPLASARLLEPLAMLWVSLAYRQGLGPDIAFGLLRR